jgi:hypothetical protein
METELKTTHWKQLCCPKCGHNKFEIHVIDNIEIKKPCDPQDFPFMCECLQCNYEFVAAYF